jgi:hypothetical protein
MKMGIPSHIFYLLQISYLETALVRACLYRYWGRYDNFSFLSMVVVVVIVVVVVLPAVLVGCLFSILVISQLWSLLIANRITQS